MQPKCQPCALETGVARHDDTFAAPERRQTGCCQCQIFHGALPDDHNSSNMVLSRKVSIACQKPRCSKAIICPIAASRMIGELSQLLLSPSIRSRQRGDRTKNPPLINPPSPRGFSINAVTAGP